MTDDSIKFSVDGTPQPKGSGSHKMIPAKCPHCYKMIPLKTGIGRRGPFVESADMGTKAHPGGRRLHKWSAWVASHAQEAMEGADIITGPVALRIMARIERPKSVKREYPTAKPDLDKLARAIQDSMEGPVFKQDAQVVELHAFKRYVQADQEPGVEVACDRLSRQGRLI